MSQAQKTDTARTALITGASAGIGATLAREFAAHGFDLVLTARRQDRLFDLAREIIKQHKVHVLVETADLVNPNAPQEIFDALKMRGIVVDVLINNAGYSGAHVFETSQLQEQRDFIEVMMTSVVGLTHLFVPGMIARGFGRVLNVASLAAFVPGGPGFTLYSASKAFLVRFTESLDHELKHKNVRVQALCPGFTYSEFHDVSGTRKAVSRMPAAMWMSAEDVAKAGYRQLISGETIHIPGRFNRFVALMARLMPPKLARHIVGGSSRRYRDLPHETQK